MADPGGAIQNLEVTGKTLNCLPVKQVCRVLEMAAQHLIVLRKIEGEIEFRSRAYLAQGLQLESPKAVHIYGNVLQSE